MESVKRLIVLNFFFSFRRPKFPMLLESTNKTEVIQWDRSLIKTDFTSLEEYVYFIE